MLEYLRLLRSFSLSLAAAGLFALAALTALPEDLWPAGLAAVGVAAAVLLVARHALSLRRQRRRRRLLEEPAGTGVVQPSLAPARTAATLALSERDLQDLLLIWCSIAADVEDLTRCVRGCRDALIGRVEDPSFGRPPDRLRTPVRPAARQDRLGWGQLARKAGSTSLPMSSMQRTVSS